MAADSKKVWLGILMAVAGTVDAQQGNALIGEWRGVTRDASNVAMAWDITFYPNSTFVKTLAVPPNNQSGMAGGIILFRGQYQLTSDHSVAFNQQDQRVCPNGDMNACMPMPIMGLPALSFRIDGGNKFVNTDTGEQGYRVQ